MKFIADKQTLDDLNLLGKYKGNSIFNVFDKTHTRGGGQVLEAMFLNPLTDATMINSRSAIFRFFQEADARFPVQKELCEETEQYLSTAGASGKAGTAIRLVRSKAMRLIASDKEYELTRDGVLATVRLIRQVRTFFDLISKTGASSAYLDSINEVKRICESTALKVFFAGGEIAVLNFSQLVTYDHLLRSACRADLEKLLQILYETDVFITVSQLAKTKKFAYATALPFREGTNQIRLTQVAHPQLPGAVANSVHINFDQNLVFLTGANMAGKSTFMKSVGIAVYLAHMGFPVAAAQMEFSVQDGIYTSINVPDNLDMGYSHFYAEVLRVKGVAAEVNGGRNLVIIFDELFKGTNVKDAYDATVAVTEAFGNNRNCSFIISTHIVEAGTTLQERSTNMQFLFFPTIMEKQIPRYTYQLRNGISADRHGMMIITNEKIIEIIRRKAKAEVLV